MLDLNARPSPRPYKAWALKYCWLLARRGFITASTHPPQYPQSPEPPCLQAGVDLGTALAAHETRKSRKSRKGDAAVGDLELRPKRRSPSARCPFGHKAKLQR